MQGDPANVATHDFGNHAAAVRVAGGAEAVHGVGRDLGGGVEAERVVGSGKVVVYCLGNTDDLDAGIRQPLGSSEGAFSADGDEGVNTEAFHVLANRLSAVGALEGVCARGAQNGATLLRDALNVSAFEGHGVAVDDSAPTVTEADELFVVYLSAFEYYTANYGVEAGAVATAGQDSNLHEPIMAHTFRPESHENQKMLTSCVIYQR